MLRRKAVPAALLLSLVSLCGTARASVERETGYTKAQTYNAALRYLRVDLSYEVTEKDADAAYLLFRFLPDGRKTTSNGSIEIVELREGVRLYVHLPELPHYREELMSDDLLRKLKNEYGDPPRHESPPPKDKDDKDRDDKDKDKSDKDKSDKDKSDKDKSDKDKGSEDGD